MVQPLQAPIAAGLNAVGALMAALPPRRYLCP